MRDSTPFSSVAFSDKNSLTAVLMDCWQSLQQAVADRDCGWRLPVLATGGEGVFRQRIVVLREVDVSKRLLFAHTDLRSSKVVEIRKNSRVNWLFYDHASKSQLLVTGTAGVHVDDDLAARFWQSEPESSLRGYLAPYAPGTVMDKAEVNLPESLIGRIPERSELQPARSNFAVIRCEVDEIEWLQLSHDGNLRARFRNFDDGAQSEWLAS